MPGGQFDWGGRLEWGALTETSEDQSGYLLGSPSPQVPSVTDGIEGVQYPTLLARQGSENAFGADNQQGSLRDPSTTARRTSRLG